MTAAGAAIEEQRRMSKEYEVGYRRPPKEHRFRKGKSGNPRGRPRAKAEKRPSDAALLMKELSSETITIQGRDYQKIEALLHALYAQAMKGNPTALRLYFQTMDKLGLLKPIEAVQRQAGVLVLPAPMNLDDWSVAVAAQQAKFRGDDPEDMARLEAAAEETMKRGREKRRNSAGE